MVQSHLRKGGRAVRLRGAAEPNQGVIWRAGAAVCPEHTRFEVQFSGRFKKKANKHQCQCAVRLSLPSHSNTAPLLWRIMLHALNLPRLAHDGVSPIDSRGGISGIVI